MRADNKLTITISKQEQEIITDMIEMLDNSSMALSNADYVSIMREIAEDGNCVETTSGNEIEIEVCVDEY